MSAPGAALAVGLLALLLTGARRYPAVAVGEARARRLLLAAAALSAVAALLAGAAEVLLAPGAGLLVFTLGAVLSGIPLYAGVLLWMETRTGEIADGDNANTAGALTLLVAIGLLVARPRLEAAVGLQFWQIQADLFLAATALIVAGTAVWGLLLAGLIGDRRMRLLAPALVVQAGVAVLVLLGGGDHRPALVLVWLAAVMVGVLAWWLPPGAGPVVVAGQETSSVPGSLLIITAGVLTLAVHAGMNRGAGLPVIVLVLVAVALAGVRMVRVVGDLTQLARSRREAMTDDLTGIANRRSVLSALDAAVTAALPVTLMIIDLDRFKEVNDRFGHAAGDRLLRRVCVEFGRRLPENGLLARLGGDEFAVLIEEDSTPRAVAAARHLLAAVPLVRDERGGGVIGASIGVAVLEPGAMTASELLRRADVAMYQAKAAGAGVRVYDRAIDAAAQERRLLLEDLRAALEGDDAVAAEQVVVHFQPQVDIDTGAVEGAEALVRWQHPRLGLLFPDRFLPLVEENGLMPALTGHVLRAAMAEAMHWRAAGHRLRVSVNLSATCLTHPSLLPLLDSVLFASETPAQDLLLEVTETSLMTNPDEALVVLREITGRGIGLSIDDYGTGYSSLSYMNILPASELKIDRSFTARLGHDPRTAAIVAGTAELAHRLGMRLVAEGTETEDDLVRVRALGCDLSQGYLHSRPLAAAVFRQWLAGQSGAGQSGAGQSGSGRTDGGPLRCAGPGERAPVAAGSLRLGPNG